MKLRIDVEKKSYEVTVEFLEDARNGHRHWQPAELDVPDSVTRLRPPLKLLEDTFCRSPIAGRIAKLFLCVGKPDYRDGERLELPRGELAPER